MLTLSIVVYYNQSCQIIEIAGTLGRRMNIENIRMLRKKLRELELGLNLQFKADRECCGVTLSQCHALLEIGRRGMISLVDLAAGLGLDDSTLSRTINGLVLLGLVQRTENPEDRRYVSLSLTDQGKKIFKTIDNLNNGNFSKIFEFIPEAKHEQIVESFILFADAVRKFRESNECCQPETDT